MKYVYTYEVVVTPPECRIPYSFQVWGPDGEVISRAFEYAHTITAAVREATQMAEKHLEGNAGQVVKRGVIDLTPKPEPEGKKRWWQRKG